MKNLNTILILLIVLMFGCSASEETTQQSEKKEPDVYIFDDIEPDAVILNDSTNSIPSVEELKSEPVKADTAKAESVNTEQPAAGKGFIIQLGAFTTKERAETFINENKSKIEFSMNIIYRDEIKLFAVQLPKFANREEAEKVRSNLWQIPSFKDAFIISLGQ